MATVVDSKQEPLPAPTIMATAARELDLKGVSAEAALAALAHEISLPDTDKVQVGNTVFLGHRGKGKSKNKLVGRAFNVDTSRNFINNYIQYLTVLRNKGVTHYSIDFDGEALVPIAKAIGKRISGLNMRAGMSAFENGEGHRVYFLLKPEGKKADV